MRVLIVSRNRFLYSTRRLRRAFLDRGHDVSVANPADCALTLGAGREHLWVEGAPMPWPDLLVPRVSRHSLAQSRAMLDACEQAGAISLCPLTALEAARDKFMMMGRLLAAGVAAPASVLIHRAADIDAAFDAVSGPPAILKVRDGGQGVGVMLVESTAGARSVCEEMLRVHGSLIVQRWIGGPRPSEGASPETRDLRLFVAGREIVACARRMPAPGDFRANFHRGGRIERIEPSAELAAAALRAADVLGIGVAGVDIIEHAGEAWVLEVNASPGFEGIEEATGVDVAGAIANYAASLPPVPETGEV